MVSWEYIQRRRKWTAELILSSLPDQSWESFQLFFAERGIECPDKGEYNSAFNTLKATPESPSEPEAEVPQKKEPTKKRPSNAKKKKPVAD